MLKLSEIRDKELININTGERMGYIYDFELDMQEGYITALVMTGTGRMLGLFGKSIDIIIPWANIVKMGSDTILVDFDGEISE